MNYFIHILIMINIYIILSLSLNILVGYGGLLSVAQGAFYGLGAYIYSLTLINLNLPFWASIIISIFCTSLIALVIGYSTLRLKGDYFILATIGFQMIIFDILYNWVKLTHGPYGISKIPRAFILGFEIRSMSANLIFIVFIALSIILICAGIYNSPFGRILKSIREDEVACQAMGKNTNKVKIWAFIITGAIAAVAGSLYSNYNTYINPNLFSLDQSIFLLAIVLLGGAGNLRGPIVGAILLIMIPELLRFLGLPETIAPNVRQIFYSLMIILFMIFRPQGLFGNYKLE